MMTHAWQVSGQLLPAPSRIVILPASMQEPNGAGPGKTAAMPRELTPEQVVAGIGTRSYVAMMDDAPRSAFLDRVRRLLATHPDTRGRDLLELPYTASAYRLTPR